jgi:hypothetical protein
VLVRYTDAGRVLSHEVCRIGQGGGQGKGDGHGHVMTPEWALLGSFTSTSFASMEEKHYPERWTSAVS